MANSVYREAFDRTRRDLLMDPWGRSADGVADQCRWIAEDLAAPPRGTGLLGRLAGPSLRARYIVRMIAMQRALAES